jgi:GNAT superfamily N-acetyltransferase
MRIRVVCYHFSFFIFMIINIANLDDFNEISELFFKSFSPLYKKFLNYNLKKSTCVAISKLYISNANMFIAREDNKIIGFASVSKSLLSLWKNPINIILPSRYIFIAPTRFRDFNKPMFTMMCVDKNYRKKGIGTKLMKEVEKYLKLNGTKNLYGQVYSKNKPIINLLIKNNWEIVAKSGVINKIFIFNKKLSCPLEAQNGYKCKNSSFI